jgi:hypothetical protein
MKNYLKELPYKIKDNDNYYYLTITKCYKGYRAMYWDFEEKVKIKQFGNSLINTLRKTKMALDILKETEEIEQLNKK